MLEKEESISQDSGSLALTQVNQCLCSFTDSGEGIKDKREFWSIRCLWQSQGKRPGTEKLSWGFCSIANHYYFKAVLILIACTDMSVALSCLKTFWKLKLVKWLNVGHNRINLFFFFLRYLVNWFHKCIWWLILLLFLFLFFLYNS